MNWRGGIKVVLLLTGVGICLFDFMLHHQSSIFREFEASLMLLQCMLLFCLAIWCGSFIYLTFSMNDLPLVCLLSIAITTYYLRYAASSRTVDPIILLAGVTCGKGARLFLRQSFTRPSTIHTHPMGEGRGEANVLVGLVLLLAFSSWWHLDLDMANNIYPVVS
jgi:hypothetical protein